MTALLRAEVFLTSRSRGIPTALLLAAAVAAGLPLLLRPSDAADGGVPAAILAEASLRTAQLPLLAAAALAGGRQFQDGHHGTAVRAVPRRGVLMLVQGTVLALWAAPAAVAVAMLGVLVPRTVGGPGYPDASAGVLAPSATAAFYLALMMVVAWGGALLLRRAWAAMAVLGALGAVVPVLSIMVPAAGYLPGGAGVGLLSPIPVDLPGSAPGWLALWALLASLAGIGAVIAREVDAQ